MREYIIDPITRKIRILKDESTIGVYNDKNVEEVQFSLTDENLAAELFGYNVYINYLAPNSESVQQDQAGEKSYDAENNKLTFSWLIGRSATQGVGKVIFIVCFQKVVDGEVEKEWNTTVASVSVLEGLEPELTEEEQELLASYYDTLVERLHEAGEAVIESIPQDYTALCEEVEDIKAALQNAGISDDVKNALLTIVSHIGVWDDDNAQDYYDALESALYPTATLSYISCVYTQSGTVYVSDTLDSLKSDLLVTAHYSDGSTVNVTTYTLSGTLTEGTSTVTVTYGGKTTTFTVNVTRYQLYDYIYNTGDVNTGGKNYVLTDLTHSPSFNTLNIEFEAMNINGASGSVALVCSNNTNTADTGNMVWYARANKGGFSAYNLGQAKQLNTVPGDTRAIIKYFFVDGGESYMQWGETIVAVATMAKSAVSQNSIPLILAGGYSINSGGVPYGMETNRGRLGYVKFTDPSDNNALVYHFIPALDLQTNTVGFYEDVNDIFYPTKGTGLKVANWS